MEKQILKKEFECSNTFRHPIMLEDNQIALCFPCKHAVFGFANELSYVTLVVMGRGCLSGIFQRKTDGQEQNKKCYFCFPVYSCFCTGGML